MAESTPTGRAPIRSLSKLDMWASFGEGKRRAKLVWGLSEGKPRITVYTNDPTDTNNGIISAPMFPDTFYAFKILFEQIIKGPNDNKYKIECKVPVYENNKPTSERRVLSEIWFGKDKDGICWSSVIAVNRPKIKFSYEMSDFSGIIKGNGTPLEKSESSLLKASADLNLLGDVYGTLIPGWES